MGRLTSQRPVAGPPDAAGPPDVEQEIEADPETVARAICLRLLTARARTRAELADALRARSVPDAAAGAVLDRLADVGLVDDGAFAEQFVASRFTNRGLAGREIARQLRERGVEEDVVRSAVGVIGSEDEFTAACRLVKRKAKAMASVAEPARQRRLVGLLARKGYSPSVAYAAVKFVLGDALLGGHPDVD